MSAQCGQATTFIWVMPSRLNGLQAILPGLGLGCHQKSKPKPKQAIPRRCKPFGQAKNDTLLTDVPAINFLSLLHPASSPRAHLLAAEAHSASLLPSSLECPRADDVVAGGGPGRARAAGDDDAEGHVVDLATTCYGCHVLRKARDCTAEDRLLIVRATPRRRSLTSTRRMSGRWLDAPSDLHLILFHS
ncbi:hypothetical protein FB451DRAFT_1405455 [Mycena latifolia]|nr:hypothetical protein FB451DRAFT_1405455 [Mycena latifolia]